MAFEILLEGGCFGDITKGDGDFDFPGALTGGCLDLSLIVFP